MLTDKLVEWYNGIVEVIAWLFLITGAIIGFIIGWGIGDFLGAFLGMPIGIIIALISEALIFPPLIVLFKIYDDVDEIYYAIGKKPAANISTPSKPYKAEQRPYIPIADREDIGPSGFKVCKKCGTPNPINNVTCKDCGEYL